MSEDNPEPSEQEQIGEMQLRDYVRNPPVNEDYRNQFEGLVERIRALSARMTPRNYIILLQPLLAFFIFSLIKQERGIEALALTVITLIINYFYLSFFTAENQVQLDRNVLNSIVPGKDELTGRIINNQLAALERLKEILESLNESKEEIINKYKNLASLSVGVSKLSRFRKTFDQKFDKLSQSQRQKNYLDVEASKQLQDLTDILFDLDCIGSWIADIKIAINERPNEAVDLLSTFHDVIDRMENNLEDMASSETSSYEYEDALNENSFRVEEELNKVTDEFNDLRNNLESEMSGLYDIESELRQEGNYEQADKFNRIWKAMDLLNSAITMNEGQITNARRAFESNDLDGAWEAIENLKVIISQIRHNLTRLKSDNQRL